MKGGWSGPGGRTVRPSNSDLSRDKFCLWRKSVLNGGWSAPGALLAFLMPDRVNIPQAHRITAVGLHLGVFQGIVFFLSEALW
jgi:hypothetical protein